MREFSPAKCNSPNELEEIENFGFAFASRMVPFCRTSRPRWLGTLWYKSSASKNLVPQRRSGRYTTAVSGS
jgi:hypothetical protein